MCGEEWGAGTYVEVERSHRGKEGGEGASASAYIQSKTLYFTLFTPTAGTLRTQRTNDLFSLSKVTCNLSVLFFYVEVKTAIERCCDSLRRSTKKISHQPNVRVTVLSESPTTSCGKRRWIINRLSGQQKRVKDLRRARSSSGLDRQRRATVINGELRYAACHEAASLAVPR